MSLTNRFNARPYNVGPDDVEMLQTDVMRFFAILCLCLMAIFALVKSMPFTTPDTRPNITDSNQLQQEAEQLKNDIENGKKNLTTIQMRIKAEKERLERIRLDLEQAKLTAQKNKIGKPSPPVTSPAPPVSAPPIAEKEGFSLKFESDMALTHLVKNRSVEFYAIAGKNAWQVRFAGNRAVFVSSKLPGHYFEMSHFTVPVHYTNTFKKSVAVFGKITWGVTLPEAIQVSIGELTRIHKGGDLIIEQNGRIRLEK